MSEQPASGQSIAFKSLAQRFRMVGQRSLIPVRVPLGQFRLSLAQSQSLGWADGAFQSLSQRHALLLISPAELPAAADLPNAAALPQSSNIAAAAQTSIAQAVPQKPSTPTHPPINSRLDVPEPEGDRPADNSSVIQPQTEFGDAVTNAESHRRSPQSETHSRMVPASDLPTQDGAESQISAQEEDGRSPKTAIVQRKAIDLTAAHLSENNPYPPADLSATQDDSFSAQRSPEMRQMEEHPEISKLASKTVLQNDAENGSKNTRIYLRIANEDTVVSSPIGYEKPNPEQPDLEKSVIAPDSVEPALYRTEDADPQPENITSDVAPTARSGDRPPNPAAHTTAAPIQPQIDQSELVNPLGTVAQPSPAASTPPNGRSPAAPIADRVQRAGFSEPPASAPPPPARPAAIAQPRLAPHAAIADIQPSPAEHSDDSGSSQSAAASVMFRRSPHHAALLHQPLGFTKTLGQPFAEGAPMSADAIAPALYDTAQSSVSDVHSINAKPVHPDWQQPDQAYPSNVPNSRQSANKSVPNEWSNLSEMLSVGQSESQDSEGIYRAEDITSHAVQLSQLDGSPAIAPDSASEQIFSQPLSHFDSKSLRSFASQPVQSPQAIEQQIEFLAYPVYWLMQQRWQIAHEQERFTHSGYPRWSSDLRLCNVLEKMPGNTGRSPDSSNRRGSLWEPPAAGSPLHQKLQRLTDDVYDLMQGQWVMELENSGQSAAVYGNWETT